MMAFDQTKEMERLVAEREAFVVATVVRARRPTSVRPGDSAIVYSDGRIDGFVGGVCAESSVRLHSLRALETGDPLLLKLIPGDVGGDRDPTEADDGAVVEHNPCLSGGSLEIFLEPHLPPDQVIVVGSSPIARTLAGLATAAGYDCRLSTAAHAGELGRAAAVVVASHGNGEEGVLAAALRAGVPYVALVASPTRGTAVRSELRVAPELAAQLHTPAGLDIGARTPAEISISILAEIVAVGHSNPSFGRPGVTAAGVGEGSPGRLPGDEIPGRAVTVTALDPVCGMTVAVVAATPQLDIDGETMYFCGLGCRERYAGDHVSCGERRHQGEP